MECKKSKTTEVQLLSQKLLAGERFTRKILA